MSPEPLHGRTPTSNEIPIIDIARLIDGDEAARRRVASRVGAACRGIGFFYVTGHGLSHDYMSGTFGQVRRFFDLPIEEKNRVSITASHHNRGYVPLEGENLDPSRRPDLKEAFNIGRDLAHDDPDVLAGRPFHGTNQWPDLPDWREAMMGHYDWMKGLCDTLHHAFALDLGLPETFLTPNSTGRSRRFAFCTTRPIPQTSHPTNWAVRRTPITAMLRCWRRMA